MFIPEPLSITFAPRALAGWRPVAAALALAGLAPTAAFGLAGEIENGEAITAVASIRPIHSLLEVVMGKQGTAVLLLDAEVSPHDAMLRPSQLAALGKADLVYIVGDGFETFDAESLEGQGNAMVIELLGLPGLTRLKPRVGDEWVFGSAAGGAAAEGADHDNHHSGPEEESHHHEESDERGDSRESEVGHAGHASHPHGHHHHGISEWDHHIWMDIGNAKAIAMKMAEDLGRLHPRRREVFLANATALGARLDDLDAEISATLAGVSKRPFIVLHDAFQYFERRYELEAVAAMSAEPEIYASAKGLVAVREAVKQNNVRCFFGDPLLPRDMVEILVEEGEGKVGMLDPIGFDIEPGPGLYFELLRAVAAEIARCLR